MRYHVAATSRVCVLHARAMDHIQSWVFPVFLGGYWGTPFPLHLGFLCTGWVGKIVEREWGQVVNLDSGVARRGVDVEVT